MNSLKFYVAGHTEALQYAVASLQKKGCQFARRPEEAVTHLLLPAPAFEGDGKLKGGGDLTGILDTLPDNIKVLGGNLQHPSLKGRLTADLLHDPYYLAENAQITAHCAAKLAMNHFPGILRGCPVLVVGWGRIGKCLAELLRSMGAYVTVAARKEADRAMVLALGYDAMDSCTQGYELVRFRVIFNTAPEMVLTKDALQYCSTDCLKIDLASKAGLEGDDVIWARGLPNQEAPLASGELIAKTVLRLR